MLITGGTRGIGLATLYEFASRPGYEIVFTWRESRERAEALCRELGHQTAINCFQLDLQAPDPQHIAAELERLGGIDIIIHNAGMAADAPFYFMDADQWQRVINTSLNSFFYLNKAVLPHMLEQRWGRIITLASISGESGNRGQANYAAAKGALIAATKSLAKEMARKGILCNVVSPGLIDTDMTSDLKFDYKALIPMARMGKPSEVAKAIAFLASDDASYINGTTLQVNGGLYT